MSGSGSLLFTFEFEGPNVRRLRTQASALADDVFVGTSRDVPVLSLRSRAPVPPGVRIEMSFMTGAGAAIDLLGVTRSFMPDGMGNYRVEVLVTPTHRHRIAALRAHARPFRSDTPVEVYREPTGPRPSAAPGISYPPTSNPNLPMRLRVRANEGLLAALHESPDRRDGGSLRIPVRREARVGRTVLIEVGLGPMVDEVVLAGVIMRARTHGPGQTEATIRVVPSHRHRVTYLAEVLRGQREPTARALPRYEMRLAANVVLHPRKLSAAIQSVSGAGVFVRSYATADVGSTVDLDIELRDSGKVRVAADVIWQSEDQERMGFGARFAPGQKDVVDRIREFIQRLSPPLETAGVPA